MTNRLTAHSGMNYTEIDFFCTLTQRQRVQAHVIGMDFLFHEVTEEPQFPSYSLTHTSHH